MRRLLARLPLLVIAAACLSPLADLGTPAGAQERRQQRCPERTQAEHRADAEVAFEGRPRAGTTTADGVLVPPVAFDVTKYLKGEGPDSVIVTTPRAAAGGQAGVGPGAGPDLGAGGGGRGAGRRGQTSTSAPADGATTSTTTAPDAAARPQEPVADPVLAPRAGETWRIYGRRTAQASVLVQRCNGTERIAARGEEPAEPSQASKGHGELRTLEADTLLLYVGGIALASLLVVGPAFLKRGGGSAH